MKPDAVDTVADSVPSVPEAASRNRDSSGARTLRDRSRPTKGAPPECESAPVQDGGRPYFVMVTESWMLPTGATPWVVTYLSASALLGVAGVPLEGWLRLNTPLP